MLLVVCFVSVCCCVAGFGVLFVVRCFMCDTRWLVFASARCVLFVVCCVLVDVWCLLFAVCCCVMCVVCCLMFVRCLMFVVRCLWFVVCLLCKVCLGGMRCVLWAAFVVCSLLFAGCW